MFFAYKKRKSNFSSLMRGASLVETLIYVFVLAILLIVVVKALASFSTSFRTISSGRAVENSAIVAFERITRELRDANSVTVGQSTLGTSPGILTFATTDSSGTAKTIQFFLTNQVLHIKEDGVDMGALTYSSARVTSLIFKMISTSVSQAVRISMTLESGAGSTYKSATFYDTAVLRASYPTQ